MRDLFDRFASAWLFFWLAFLAVYAHSGALAFAGLVVLLGAVGWAVWLLYRPVPFGSLVVLLPIAFLLVWMAITTVWGDYDAAAAWRLGIQIALSAAIPALLVSRVVATRLTLSHLIMAMSLGGVAVILLDVMSGFAINTLIDPVSEGSDLNTRQGDAEMNLGRGQVAYAMLTPLLLGLFASYLPRRWALPASLAFILLLVGSAFANRLFVPVLMLAVALPFVWIGYHRPGLGRRAGLALAAASVLFAPLIGWLARSAGEPLMARLPMSWDHRLRMWDYTLARISERPLLGHGLDASRGLQDGFTTRIGVDVPFVSLHPHNIGLQVWLELGAIGALIFMVAILFMDHPLRRLSPQPGWRGAAVAGTLACAATGSALTVGAWQYWWWGLIALAFMLIVLISEDEPLLN